LRSFQRIWLPLFVFAVGAALRWRFGLPSAAAYWWLAATAVALLALASVAIARLVFVGLTIATYPIAFVVSTAVLGIMFVAVITPLGWWLRVRGHDPLRLRGRGAPSYWRPYEQNDEPTRAVRQF
jgi:hypothetical protein